MRTYDLEVVAKTKKLFKDLDGQEVTRKDVERIKKPSEWGFLTGQYMGFEKMVKIGALVKTREEIGYYHSDDVETIWKIDGKRTDESITPLLKQLLLETGHTVETEETDVQEYRRFIYTVRVSAFDIFAKNETQKKKEALQEKLEKLQQKILEVQNEMLETQAELNNLG